MKPILKIKIAVNKSKEYQIYKEGEIFGRCIAGAASGISVFNKETSPYSPDASSLFINGPSMGTSDLTFSQFVINGKRPAIGSWKESNCGSLLN